MGLNLEYTDGQTPIDDDEKEGLLKTTITTRGELNESEQLGVEEAVQWSRRRKFSVEQILSEDFILELHWRMFKDVWRWAGEIRTVNKNIGVDHTQIRIELRTLLDDCRYWIGEKRFSEDEIAVRFSHRVVRIHPFANGNGRHSRFLGDILVSHGFGREHFSWGRTNLTDPGEARSVYLKALHEADENSYRSLVIFARD